MQAWQRLLGPGFERRTVFKACPMEGKHAPGLACGELSSRTAEFFDEAHNDMLAECDEISADGLKILLDDWALARGIIDYVFEAKMAHWLVLPWLLAGIAHPDLARARSCARQCMDQWDARSVPDQHHPLSVRFLAPGPLRDEIERFAAGAPWEALSDDFVWALLPLKFVPVVECIIEGRHALISRRLAGHHKKRHPTTVSLASGRLAEFGRRVTLDATVMDLVASEFKRVSNFKKAAMVLNLMEHPKVQCLHAGGSVHITPCGNLQCVRSFTTAMLRACSRSTSKSNKPSIRRSCGRPEQNMRRRERQQMCTIRRRRRCEI